MKNFDELVNKILLTESPILSDSELSINLDNEQTNKQAINDCFENGKQVKNFEKYKVYEIKNNNFRYFCFIENNVVEGYVEFFIDDQNVYSKRVLQRKSGNNKGLLRRAFLNYFSHLFSDVILDKIANNYGKQFFKKLMKEANATGFKTTIVDEKAKCEALYEDKNFEQYWSSKTIVDGRTVGYYDLLFKIYYK